MEDQRKTEYEDERRKQNGETGPKRNAIKIFM